MQNLQRTFNLFDSHKLNSSIQNHKYAFTLAEILITIAIIGVVAAMTIPTLVSKINAITNKNRMEVIEDRLTEGLNAYNTMEHGLSIPYTSTAQFLEGLSKYYKIVQICDSDELDKCFPYSEIKYTSKGESKKFLIKDFEDVTNLGVMGIDASNYYAPAGFINAQGTPFAITLKRNCITDPDKAMRSISECIVGIYDINGSRKPNKYGLVSNSDGTKSVEADIIPINGGRVGDAIFAEINGVKILTKVFQPNTIVSDKYDCSSEETKNYGIKTCSFDNDKDLWGQAMYYCHQMGGSLPDINSSFLIFQGLYSDASGKNPTDAQPTNVNYAMYTPASNYTLDKELLSKLGLSESQSSMMLKDLTCYKSTCDVVYYRTFFRPDVNGKTFIDKYSPVGVRTRNNLAICIQN